jgi:hypothetical protein
VNTVLASQIGPRGGATGTVALPSTGQGGDRAGTDWLVMALALVTGGAGLIGIMELRQRLR